MRSCACLRRDTWATFFFFLCLSCVCWCSSRWTVKARSLLWNIAAEHPEAYFSCMSKSYRRSAQFYFVKKGIFFQMTHFLNHTLTSYDFKGLMRHVLYCTIYTLLHFWRKHCTIWLFVITNTVLSPHFPWLSLIRTHVCIYILADNFIQSSTRLRQDTIRPNTLSLSSEIFLNCKHTKEMSEKYSTWRGKRPHCSKEVGVQDRTKTNMSTWLVAMGTMTQRGDLWHDVKTHLCADLSDANTLVNPTIARENLAKIYKGNWFICRIHFYLKTAAYVAMISEPCKAKFSIL